MQQLKTDNPLAELPELTEKQHKYVLARLSGLSKAESVRECTADSQEWSDQSIWSEAWRIESNKNVRRWLDVIRLEKAQAAAYTHDQYISELEELRQLAIQSGNLGAAVQATINKGKSTGHMIERTQDMTPTQDTDLVQLLRVTLGEDMAEIASKRLGLQ